MPTDNEMVESLVLELRRGTVVLAALSQLRERQYGYSLVGLLSARGVPVEANTLYPLLRRLEAQGLLRSEWDTDESKPRKYYELTAQGARVTKLLADQWNETVRRMAELTEGI